MGFSWLDAAFRQGFWWPKAVLAEVAWSDLPAAGGAVSSCLEPSKSRLGSRRWLTQARAPSMSSFPVGACRSLVLFQNGVSAHPPRVWHTVRPCPTTGLQPQLQWGQGLVGLVTVQSHRCLAVEPRGLGPRPLSQVQCDLVSLSLGQIGKGLLLESQCSGPLPVCCMWG